MSAADGTGVDSSLSAAGRLEGTSVAELVWAAAQAGHTGSLILKRGDQRRVLYLRAGQVVFAASNDPEDRFGTFLLRRGEIGLGDLIEAGGKVARGRRLGRILVERRVIAEDQLARLVLEQVRSVALSVFGWREGEWSLSRVGLPEDEPLVLRIPTHELVLAGVRRVRSWHAIRRAVGGPRAAYRKGRSGSMPSSGLSRTEQAIVDHVARPIRIEALCRKIYAPSFDVYRSLWALSILGLVERVDSRLVDTSETDEFPETRDGFISSLEETAAVLLDLGERRFTGVARFFSGAREGALFLRDGNVEFATTNETERSLLAQLLRRGVIADRDHEAAERRMISGKRIGVILAEQGAIDADEVDRFVSEQILDVAKSVALWPEGEYQIEEGLPTREEIVLDISPEELLMAAIEGSEVFEPAWARIGGLDALVRLTPQYLKRLDRMRLRPAVWEIVSLLGEERTVTEVLSARSENDFEILRLLFALQVVGVAQRVPEQEIVARARQRQPADKPMPAVAPPHPADQPAGPGAELDAELDAPLDAETGAEASAGLDVATSAETLETAAGLAPELFAGDVDEPELDWPERDDARGDAASGPLDDSQQLADLEQAIAALKSAGEPAGVATAEPFTEEPEDLDEPGEIGEVDAIEGTADAIEESEVATGEFDAVEDVEEPVSLEGTADAIEETEASTGEFDAVEDVEEPVSLEGTADAIEETEAPTGEFEMVHDLESGELSPGWRDDAQEQDASESLEDTPEQEFAGVPTGKHELVVELGSGDGSPIEPEAEHDLESGERPDEGPEQRGPATSSRLDAIADDGFDGAADELEIGESEPASDRDDEPAPQRAGAADRLAEEAVDEAESAAERTAAESEQADEEEDSAEPEAPTYREAGSLPALVEREPRPAGSRYAIGLFGRAKGGSESQPAAEPASPRGAQPEDRTETAGHVPTDEETHLDGLDEGDAVHDLDQEGQGGDAAALSLTDASEKPPTDSLGIPVSLEPADIVEAEDGTLRGAADADVAPSERVDDAPKELQELGEASQDAPEQAAPPPVVDESVFEIVDQFNARHRIVFQQLRVEIGAGISNYIQTCQRRLGAYGDLFESAALRRDGSFAREELARALSGREESQLAESLDALIDMEIGMIRDLLPRARVEQIEQALAALDD
ncbi:MAG: DUF4388 domain-containing protein [Acidobacteriota bacterium]|nr:MAG: DUF4388 domain-containing protein [Acidobacteriota bacterium]